MMPDTLVTVALEMFSATAQKVVACAGGGRGDGEWLVVWLVGCLAISCLALSS
jgi:hypothetical protein